MTSLFGSRQRAAAFAALVDGAADALRSTAQPPEDRRHGAEDDRLAGVVTTLRRHAKTAQPGSAFSVASSCS